MTDALAQLRTLLPDDPRGPTEVVVDIDDDDLPLQRGHRQIPVTATSSTLLALVARAEQAKRNRESVLRTPARSTLPPPPPPRTTTA